MTSLSFIKWAEAKIAILSSHCPETLDINRIKWTLNPRWEAEASTAAQITSSFGTFPLGLGQSILDFICPVLLATGMMRACSTKTSCYLAQQARCRISEWDGSSPGFSSWCTFQIMIFYSYHPMSCLPCRHRCCELHKEPYDMARAARSSVIAMLNSVEHPDFMMISIACSTLSPFLTACFDVCIHFPPTKLPCRIHRAIFSPSYCTSVALRHPDHIQGTRSVHLNTDYRPICGLPRSPELFQTRHLPILGLTRATPTI